MKRVISIVVFVLLLGIAFGTTKYLISSKETPKKTAKSESSIGVKVMKVSYATKAETVSYTGRVTSQGIVELGSEVSGRIIKGDVPLKEGQAFRKGQTIVRVFSNDVKQNLKSTKASFLTNLSAALPDLKVDYPNEYDKWYRFFESIDLNKELPNLPKINSSKEKVFLSSSNLLTSYYSIRQQEINLQKYQIYAPFTGVFMSVQKEVGSIASMGGTIGTIISTDRQEIIVPFLPNDVMQVKKGDLATVHLPNGTTISAKIVRIGEFVDPTTQMVNVYVSTGNNSGILSGQFLTVEFDGLSMTDVVKVPRESVFSGNKMYKVVDNKLTEIEVHVVRTSDDNSYVNGIPENSNIVIESVSNSKEGDVVRPL